jgi:CheY-like chemotaxis protein
MSGVLQFVTDQASRHLPPQTQDTPPELQDESRLRNILIVDDSHFERHVIRAAVEGLTNFRVCGEAANGAEAIQRALQLRPDLVVMDLAMPLMNGVEAAMVLRNAMPKVPIVLFTLYAEQLRGAISQAFGVTLIVSKTDGLAALLGCLERLLARD